jgi:hypothetical protein
MTRYIVGIDPGVNTGFALWGVELQKIEEVSTLGIVEAMLRVQRIKGAGTLHMVIFEDARLRTWFGSKGREALQGAGSIKRDCQVWAEWLAYLGCAYKAVSPQSKGAKVDAEQFKRLTGWTGRTSEHGRDAAMLVLGMKALA